MNRLTAAARYIAELKRRVRQSQEARQPIDIADNPALALFGDSLTAARDECAASETSKFIGHYADISEFAAQKPAKRLDVAIVEWPSLQPDWALEITRYANRLNARHLVLIYDFASRAALQRVAADRITALRSPVDIAPWRLWLRGA